MKIHRSPVFTAFILVIASVGVLLAGWPGGSARRTLRLATTPRPGDAYLQLAQKRGYFRDLDLDVQLVEFESSTEARRAYVRGHVDGFSGTFADIFSISGTAGRAPKVVLVTDMSCGADVLLAAPDVLCLADLSGRSIAIAPGTNDVLLLTAALRAAHLTLDDVRLVTMPTSAMAEAIESKRVQAICVDAVTADGLESDSLHRIFDTSAAPESILSCVAFGADFLRSRRTEVEGIVEAFYRAVEWGDKNPAEAIAWMASRDGRTSAEFTTALERVRVTHRRDLSRLLAFDGAFPGALRLAIDAYSRSGVIRIPSGAADLIDSGPSLSAAKR